MTVPVEAGVAPAEKEVASVVSPSAVLEVPVAEGTFCGVPCIGIPVTEGPNAGRRSRPSSPVGFGPRVPTADELTEALAHRNRLAAMVDSSGHYAGLCGFQDESLLQVEFPSGVSHAANEHHARDLPLPLRCAVYRGRRSVSRRSYSMTRMSPKFHQCLPTPIDELVFHVRRTLAQVQQQRTLC